MSVLDLATYLRTREPIFLERLGALVGLDSGTDSTAGVNRVVDTCAGWLREEGWIVDRHQVTSGGSAEKFGDLLVARCAGDLEGTVLLLGHTDTVFPDGTAAARPFRIDGTRALGPGVSDMKAGLLAGMFGVEALRTTSSAFGKIVFILDPDEEVGSPASRAWIAEEARRADAVLVLEAARADGAVVTARKGVSTALMEFQGRAAHAGVEPEKGRSAILESAHKVIALHALNGRWEGTTVNVGVSRGGSRINVVPEHAAIEVELRSVSDELLTVAEAEVTRLASEAVVPGVTATLEITHEHRPMERSEGTAALFHVARRIAADLGIALEERSTGGASDANITSALGVPTLDGLGPIGGDDHSPNEWIDVSSITPRTALLAALIGSIGSGITSDGAPVT